MFKLVRKLGKKGIWLIVCSVFISFIFIPSIVKAEKVTLKFWLTTAELEEVTAWKELSEEYMTEHPNVTVEVQDIPSTTMGGGEQKVLTAFAGGTAPDVMLTSDETLMGFAKRRSFADLGPLMKKHPIVDPEDMFPHIMEMFQYEGKQYGIPSNGGPIIVYYNKTLFKEAGLNYPSYSWTMDDILEDWKKLTKDVDNDGRIDQFGVEITKNWIYFMPWLIMYGAEYLSPLPFREGETRCAVNCPEGIKAFQWWQDLRWKHNVTPTPAQEGILAGELFKTGRTASRVTGPWMLGEYRKVEGLNWDIAHTPTGPKGYKATRWTYDGLIITQQSKYKEETWEFMEFLMSPTGQRSIAKRGLSIPALISVAYEPVYLRPDTPQHEEIMLEAMEQYARIQPYNPYWEEISVALQEQVDLLLLNKISAKECVERMEKEVNEILGVE